MNNDIFRVNQKTEDQIADEQLVLINAHAVDGLDNVIKNYEKTHDMVWNNPYSTPHKIFQRMNGDGYKIFQTANMTINYIHQFRPTWPPPMPPYEYTIAEDGHVTVGDLIVVPEPQPE